MSPVLVVFSFIISFNMVLMLLGGMDEYLLYPLGHFRKNRRRILSHWAFRGAQLLFWGIVAWLVQEGMSFLPQGRALFLPFFIFAYLLLRAVLLALARKLDARSGHIVNDLAVNPPRDPMIIMPMLIIGYLEMSLPLVLLTLLSIWFGQGLGSSILLTLKRRIELENSFPMQRGQGVLFLAASLLTLVFMALHQAFYGFILL